jgi:N-carbamoyl-L-amino-acid hydrolase
MTSQQRDHSDIRVDGERLWARVMEMAEIGATPAGGVHRVALTDEDREGRDLFTRWCEAARLEVSVDGIGNIFARRPGRFRDAPPVVIGSHLDSQPSGGKFDGALGVLAALEAVETLNDHEVETDHPIEVASWTNEEGSRFAPAMVASGVFAGVFDLEWARAIQDKWGVRMGDELRRIGYEGPHPVGGRDIRASFELHIEQGPVLESANTAIGVVTGVQGQRWYNVRVEGEATHAGPVPMKLRRDPVRGLARLLDRLFERVRAYDDQGRATVGVLEAVPGSRNTQPGSVHLTVDLRHPNDEDLTVLDGHLRELAATVEDEMELQCHVDEIWHSPTVHFAEECVAAVRDAADRLGYSHMDVFSGAGHDSVYLQRICPTSMIFVPCEGGVSHAEHENITAADAEAGANVLLHAAMTVAK